MGQNLVPNGDFEGFREIDSPLDWYSPVHSSPVYYNLGNTNKSLDGIIPHSGKAYVRLGLFYLPKGDFRVCRDYISVKLTSALIEGQRYCVRFFIALSNSSDLVSSHIGIYFSGTSLKDQVQPTTTFLNCIPQIVNAKPFIIDTTWIEISGSYLAKGGETTISIGNYSGSDNVGGKIRSETLFNKYKFDPKVETHFACYFIDDVSVEQITNEFYCTRPGEPKILSGIYFDEGKSVLLSASYPVLDQLAEYLLKESTTTVDIMGYTDNIGRNSVNQKLSNSRAKAVLDYLVSKGINKNRLSYKGYGSANPIDLNSTIEGRQKNRRVEIKIISK
jgi:OmpA-OmpF porin, OOP family